MSLFPSQSATDVRRWRSLTRGGLTATLVAVPILAVALVGGALSAPGDTISHDELRAPRMADRADVPTSQGIDTSADALASTSPAVLADHLATADEHESEYDDHLFTDVPDVDDHDGGGIRVPPHQGPTDLAPNPRVFHLVAPQKGSDPELDGGAHGVGDIAADVGCGGRCIEQATAKVGGVDVAIDVHTDRPARIWVILDGGIGARDSGNVLTEHFAVDLDGLTPNTTYQVTLVAEDEHGRSDHRYGEITTQARQALVTFSSIDVIDDADHGKVNRGEIEFFFRADHEWLPDLHEGTQKIRSGRSVHFDGRGKKVLVTDAPRLLELAVQGLERDRPMKFCSHGTPPFAGLGGGDAGPCIDYATAWGVINLDELVAVDQALPGPHPFRMVTESYYLKFAVNGTINITYV